EEPRLGSEREADRAADRVDEEIERRPRREDDRYCRGEKDDDDGELASGHGGRCGLEHWSCRERRAGRIKPRPTAAPSRRRTRRARPRRPTRGWGRRSTSGSWETRRGSAP